MKERTKVRQQDVRPLIKGLSDQFVMTALGVIGFLLLIATIYVLAIS